MTINIFMYIYIGENAHWDIYAPPGKSLHKNFFQIFSNISILGRSRDIHVYKFKVTCALAVLLAKWSDSMAAEQITRQSDHLHATGGGG